MDKKFVLRGTKLVGVKLVNNKTFAQAVQQNVELYFLSVNSDTWQFFFPSCYLLQVDYVDSTVPAPITKLLASYVDIF